MVSHLSFLCVLCSWYDHVGILKKTCGIFSTDTVPLNLKYSVSVSVIIFEKLIKNIPFVGVLWGFFLYGFFFSFSFYLLITYHFFFFFEKLIILCN